MKKMNLGCGDDIKEGWVNIDDSHRVLTQYEYGTEVEGWNVKFPPPHFYQEQFDFVLINHVLCTMKPSEALDVLKHARMCLKEGGKVHVIDMDLNRVFESYDYGHKEDIPISEGSIDDRLCLAISGYGTRLSHYTSGRMVTVLKEAGYHNIKQILYSEYDTRPKESLAFEAVK